MKALLLITYLLILYPLNAVDQLGFFYGVSSTFGINSGVKLENDFFNSIVDINVLNDSWHFEKGYFKSDYISLGPVSFSGVLKEHQSEVTTLFSFIDNSEVSIYKEGNPELNSGIIFSVREINLGISGFKKAESTQFFLWKTFNFINGFETDLIQSFSFPDKLIPDDSWYLNDYKIKSLINGNSTVSLIYEDEDFWGRGILSLALSPEDPPGVSFHGMGAFLLSTLFIQNEIRFNTEYYRSADLKVNHYPFLYKGNISSDLEPFSFSSSILFLLGREPLLWESRTWSIKSESDFNYKNSLWIINSGLTFSLYKNNSSELFIKYLINFSLKRSFGSFYTEAEGIAGYDKLFSYQFSFSGGYDGSLIEFSLKPELDISRKIVMNNYLRAKLKTEKFNFLLTFSLENVALYNSDPLSMQFDFFAGLEFSIELFN